MHLYEGVDPQQLRAPTYTLKLIGCEALLLTTAVGASLYLELRRLRAGVRVQPASPTPATPLVGVPAALSHTAAAVAAGRATQQY